MLCLFMIAATSLFVIGMIDSQTAQTSAVRNSLHYERALYLAGAAVHHAMSMLEEDNGWRGDVIEGGYPADNSYSASAADGAGDEIIITGTGVSGGVSRSLQVTVGPGG